MFSAESNGEGPRSKFEQEDGQTDREKIARARVCEVSGATLHPILKKEKKRKTEE